MKKIILLMVLIAFVYLKNKAQTIVDFDGNLYNTITIGTQTWMQENLKTTRFNNGISIPTTSASINNDTNALYQWAYNDDTLIANVYGLLYTWNIVNNNQNVCPIGWHIPNNTEWETLTTFLGGDSIAGGKMKDTGTTHWTQTNNGANNSSGFTGLGNGFRGNPTGFLNLNVSSSFWSLTPFGSIGNFPRGYVYKLVAINNSFQSGVAVANNGNAIRCIKDSTLLGTKNYSPREKIQIFPNPAKNRMTISFEQKGNYLLVIYNILGNQILKQKVDDTLNYIDIASFPNGTYFAQIITDDFIVSHKFIKE